MTDNLINVYCDESCHLENDHQPIMVLGGVWLPGLATKTITDNLRDIKELHGLKRHQEIKWNKVSPAKLGYYLALINFFFDCEDLSFRGLVVQEKNRLQHNAFSGQNHDNWYYKMYFSMLKQIFRKENSYNIYLDIKDTQGGRKTRKLHEIICNSFYDFDRNIIKRIQIIRSHESEIIQLADIIIGALSYVHRGMRASKAKQAIIDLIKERSQYSLEKNSLLSEKKFNIFLWQPQDH